MLHVACRLRCCGAHCAAAPLRAAGQRLLVEGTYTQRAHAAARQLERLSPLKVPVLRRAAPCSAAGSSQGFQALNAVSTDAYDAGVSGAGNASFLTDTTVGAGAIAKVQLVTTP